MKLRKCFSLYLASVLVLTFLGCEEPETRDIQRQPGDLLSSEVIQQYTSAEIATIMTGIGYQGANIQDRTIKAVKLRYVSQDHRGENQELSGAILYPLDGGSHPLLSIQHGTVTLRTAVASVNPMNSSAGISALLSASEGYVTLVPDYAGYGDSQVMHPYMHAESLANSVIDLIRAARVFCEAQDIRLTSDLYLTGYSEGGYACLATQKKMESALSDEFTLTAVAPMAGPYDLQAVAQHILEGESYAWPAYIGFLFVAYDELYAINDLSSVFRSPYDQELRSLYSGDYDFFEINARLPGEISELIEPQFRADYLSGSASQFSNAFADNSLLDWQPESPLCFYHGTDDMTVPYFVVEETVANFVEMGATEVTLVGIPGANHSTAGLPAFMAMLEWFSSTYEDDSAVCEVN